MPDVTVTYKNSSVTTLNDSGTRILETAGNYCEDNIIISYSKAANTYISSSTWYLDANNNLVM